MNSGKLLLGVLVGFAAGAIVGVLFAPDKGSETRKKISKKGEDYANSMKKKFDEFINDILEKAETAKEEATDITGKRKAKAEEVKK